MIKFYTNKIIIPFMLLTFFSCHATRHENKAPFRIKDAFYYSWFVNERERGTNIEVTIEDLKGDNRFYAIVFRNREIPVTAIIIEKQIMLRAVLTGPESVLRDRSETAEVSDRILFVHNGDTSSMSIDTIRREETKYLRPK